MNEQPYDEKHLREYTGILTSEFSGQRFKMELKVEDSPVLERSVEKIESSIELEFYYDWNPSTSFSHAIFSCPKHSKNEQCDECDTEKYKYRQTESNLKRLQVGDTFRIMAALFKDGRSTLPPEVIDFKNYQPLMVAGDKDPLRLSDTPAGINKKYEREQQRLQLEREAEEKRIEEEARHKEEEERRKEEEEGRKKREKWDRLEQWLAKYPNIMKISIAIIGTTIANQTLLFIGKKIYDFIFPN